MGSHSAKNDYEVSSYSHVGVDAEKGGLPIYTAEAPAVPGEVFITGDTPYAKIQRTVSKFGVEPRGIERVPEDERTDTNLMKVGTMVGFFESHIEKARSADMRFDSGSRPTWSSPPSPLVHWQSQCST